MYSPYSVSSSNPSPPAGLHHHAIKPEPITAGLQHQQQVMHLGGPRLVIVEQPQKRFRFRYESELGGTHGQLAGRSGADRRSYPTVKLEGASSVVAVSVRCDLYTVEEVPGISPVAHVHTLQGRNCSRGSAEIKIDAQTHFTASFQGLGIIHTAKKQMVEKIMCRKLDEEKMAIERNNPDKLWSPTERDIARVRELANRESQRINMNRVCLRFQAIMLNPKTMMPEEVCRPVYSDPIYNGKSAQTGELKIVQLSEAYSPCTGNKEIWLLVERVRKNDIRVRVYEEDENQQEVWCDYGRMVRCHHQYAIIFQTPAYRNKQLRGVVRVYIQLERPTDGCVSEPKNFQYTERDQRSTKRFCSVMDQPVADHDSKSPDQALSVQPALQQRQQQPFHQGFLEYGIPGIADGLHKLQRAGYPSIIREAMLQQAQTVFPLYHHQHSMSQMGSPLTTHMGSPMVAQMGSPMGVQMGSPMGTQMGSPIGAQMSSPIGGGGSVQMCTSPLSSKPSPQQMSASVALSGVQMTPLSLADSQHSQQMSPPVQFGIGGATVANMNQAPHADGGLPTHNVPQTFNMPTHLFTSIRPQQMPQVSQHAPASSTYLSGHMNARANVNYNNHTETANANSAGSVLNEKELHDFLAQLPLDALAEGLCPNPAPKTNKTPRGVAVRGIGAKSSNGVADPGDRLDVAGEDEPQVQQLEPEQKLSNGQETNQRETKMLYTALDGQTFSFTASSDVEPAALQDSMRFLTGLESRDGDTPLHVASWYGRPDAVATLLQILNKLPEPLRHGIVNATNIRKQVAFHVACMGGFVDCVDLLLTAGAQSHLVDENGNTGLHLASLGGATGVIKRLLQEDYVAKLLLQTNYKGMSALHLAVLGGSLETVSLLCAEGGTDVNVRDDTEGRTCLHLAVSQNSVDMVQLLLNTPGVRVDLGTFGDTTPLQLACRLGSRRLTAMLVAAGADTCRRSVELAPPPCEELLDTAIDDQEDLDCEEDGLDAFMYARASGDPLLLDLLESRDKAEAYLTSLERAATDLPPGGDPCVTAAVENGYNQRNGTISLQQGGDRQVIGDPSEGHTRGRAGGHTGSHTGEHAEGLTGGHIGAQKVAERDDDMERPLSELLDADPAICRSLAELLELDSQAAQQVNSPAKYILNCVKKYNIPLSHLAHLLDCLGLQEANDLVMRNIVE